MTALLLVIAKDIPSQNVTQRWHWSKQRKEVKRWSAMCAQVTDAKRVGVWASRVLSPDIPGKAHFLYRHDTWTGFGKRAVRITSYRGRLLTDHANLVGGCKGLIDGLVRSGLLVDDSDEWMSATYFQELRSHPENPTPGKSCTVVEITEATTTPDTGKEEHA